MRKNRMVKVFAVDFDCGLPLIESCEDVESGLLESKRHASTASEEVDRRNGVRVIVRI